MLHEHRIGPGENTREDGERGAHAVVDAGHFEVGVSNGRIDKHGTQGDGGQHAAEIERHPGGIGAVDAGNERHVTAVAPTGEIAAFVLREGCECATGDHSGDSVVEGRILYSGIEIPGFLMSTALNRET